MINSNNLYGKSINEVYGRGTNYGNLFEFTYAASLYRFFINGLVAYNKDNSVDEIYDFIVGFARKAPQDEAILQNTETTKTELGTVYFQYKIRSLDITLILKPEAEGQIKKLIQSSLNSFHADKMLDNISQAIMSASKSMLMVAERTEKLNPSVEIFVKMDGLDTAINIGGDVIGQAKSDVSWFIKTKGKEISKSIVSLKLGSKTLTNRSPYEILNDIALFAKVNVEQQTKLQTIASEIDSLSKQYDSKKRTTEITSQEIAKTLGKDYLFSNFEEKLYAETQAKYKSNTAKPKTVNKENYKEVVSNSPTSPGVYLLTQADKVQQMIEELTTIKTTYVEKVLEYTNLLIQTISQVTDIKLKDFFEFVKLNLFGSDTDEVVLAKLPKTKDPVIKSYSKNDFSKGLESKLEYIIVPENKDGSKTIKFNAIIATKKMPLISVRLKNSQLYPLNVHARKLDFKTMVELPAKSMIMEESSLYDALFYGDTVGI